MPMIENMVQMAKLTVKANVFIVRTEMRLPCSVMGIIEAPARVQEASTPFPR